MRVASEPVLEETGASLLAVRRNSKEKEMGPGTVLITSQAGVRYNKNRPNRDAFSRNPQSGKRPGRAAGNRRPSHRSVIVSETVRARYPSEPGWDTISKSLEQRVGCLFTVTSGETASILHDAGHSSRLLLAKAVF